MENQEHRHTDSTWSEDFSHKLTKQRVRAKDYLATQRKRFEQIEVRMTNQIDRIEEQLAIVHVQSNQDASQIQQETGRLQTRATRLDEQDARLARLQQELDQRQNELDLLGPDGEQASLEQKNVEAYRKQLETDKATVDQPTLPSAGNSPLAAYLSETAGSPLPCSAPLRVLYCVWLN